MSKGLYVTSAEDNIVMNHSGIPGNSFLCKFANRIQGAVVFEEFPFEKKIVHSLSQNQPLLILFHC